MDNPNHIRETLGRLKEQGNKMLEFIKGFKIKNIDFKEDNSNDFNIKSRNMKVALSSLMIISIIALCITGYRVYDIKMRAFDVYLGEDIIGTVRNQEEVNHIMDNLEKELSNTYNIDVVLDKDIRFEQTRAKDELITSSSNLQKEIKSKMHFLVSGYALEVDGVEVGVLKTKEDVEAIISEIKQPYEDMAKEGTDIKDISIVENIQVVKREVPLNKIKEKEDLYNHLLTGSEEIKTHMVEVGESFWTIAKIYNLSVDELEAANPDKNPEKLQIGDEVKLIVPKSVLTVATVLEVEYTENINYETEIEYDDTMYKNQKKTKINGSNGERKVLAEETKHNGILVDKDIVKEEVITNPVTEVIVKGTKEVPKTVATGTFLMPTRGRVSSRYGMRSGRMHSGLDIAAPIGTAIKAADGGKVIYSGSNRSGYGKMVEIDHGNGFITRYAHCSKLLVSVGDKIYKGQHIANVGNTGRSTGPHLHFEVLKNGKNYNPSNYVK